MIACDGGIFYSNVLVTAVKNEWHCITDLGRSGLKTIMMIGAHTNGTLLRDNSILMDGLVQTEVIMLRFCKFCNPRIAYSDYGGKIISEIQLQLDNFSINKLPTIYLSESSH